MPMGPNLDQISWNCLVRFPIDCTFNHRRFFVQIKNGYWWRYQKLQTRYFFLFYFRNLCPSANLSQECDCYGIKMFPIKILRPDYTKKNHINSNSQSGVFKMVKKKKMLKMAILAAWEFWIYEFWVNSVRKKYHQISLTGLSPGGKTLLKTEFFKK